LTHRKITAIFAALAVSVLASTAAIAADEFEPLPTHRPNLAVMKVAHRGVAKYAPENTLPAIEKAIELGLDYVELDVRYTEDGMPVLMHDPSVDRTTDGEGPVGSYTLDEIRKLDAGYSSKFGDKFAGTRVPTLEEVLELMQGRLNLYLHQKESPRPVLLELLRKYEFFPGRMVVVGGSEREALLRQMAPDAPVMPPVGSVDRIPEVLEKFPHPKAFNTSAHTITKELIDEAHRRGILIFTNTLGWGDAEPYMRRAIELGSDAIQTDHPIVLLKTIHKMKKEHLEKKQ